LLTPQNTMKLYGVVKSERKLPLQEATNILNEHRPRPLSDRSVQRNLYETKYHKCVVKRGVNKDGLLDISSLYSSTLSKACYCRSFQSCFVQSCNCILLRQRQLNTFWGHLKSDEICIESRGPRTSGDLLTSSVSSILSFCIKREITLIK
jgi:hypothetical protein